MMTTWTITALRRLTHDEQSPRRKMNIRGFDVKCLALAEAFARDWRVPASEAGDDTRRKLTGELAQAIQDTIEVFEAEHYL